MMWISMSFFRELPGKNMVNFLAADTKEASGSGHVSIRFLECTAEKVDLRICQVKGNIICSVDVY